MALRTIFIAGVICGVLDGLSALALSAGTHWWADRRIHLKALANATGNGNFYQLGGPLGGSYALDQAFHHAVETAAAVIAFMRTSRDDGSRGRWPSSRHYERG